MSLRTICSLAVVLFVVYPLNAATYFVGTCHAGSFPTINSAVNSATVEPGSIIRVCAGTYAEQVIISKPLIIEGIMNPPGQVLITASSSMQTTVSPISNSVLTPLVWVTTGPVTIRNITVSDHPSSCLAEYAGFYFASGASGSVLRDSSEMTCLSASVWVENATSPATSVTIRNNFLDSGIVAQGFPQSGGDTPLLAVDIASNEITPNLPSFLSNYYGNGIFLYGVSGTVTDNSVFGPKLVTSGGTSTPYNGIGIWDEAPDVTVSHNTIMFGWAGEDDPSYHSYGIVIVTENAMVDWNRISGTEYGIDLRCHSGTVSDNTINLSNIALTDVLIGFTGLNSIYNSSTPTAAGTCDGAVDRKAATASPAPPFRQP